MRKTVYKVRALVMDSKGRVYGMRATADHVLQLPGGSRKPDENSVAALKREIREETGFKIRVVSEIGTVTVKRNGVREVTTFYLTMTKGKRGERKLTKTEIKRGLKPVRYKNAKRLQNALRDRVTAYKRSAVRRDHMLVTMALQAS